MNNSGIITSTTLINALVIALANILLVEDGAPVVNDVTDARRLLVEVFTSPTSGNHLKISCMKFVLANTDMDLKTAKDFVLDYVFVPQGTSDAPSRIRRMQYRLGIQDKR